MNNALQEFEQLSRSVGLELPADKMEAVLFGKVRSLVRKPLFKLGTIPVRLGTTIKYLGLTIEENLNWITHIEYLRKKMVNLYSALGSFKSGSYCLP